MKTVLLDTDFLLDALRWRVDVVEQICQLLDEKITFCVFDSTFRELKGKSGEKLVATYLAQHQVNTLQSDDRAVDDLALEVASNDLGSVFVATQDKLLKEKLKKRGIPILTIRQKRRVIQCYNVL